MRFALRTRPMALALMGAVAVALSSGSAHAIECKDLPQPFYGVGGNSLKTILGKIASEMATTASPRTAVFRSPGNCQGINELAAGTKQTGTASYWNAAGKEQSCDLPLAGATPVFGALNTYPTACAGVSEVPSDIRDYIGPVQSFNIVVPKSSQETAISSDALYFILGFGAQGQASPWTNESQIFRRDTNSAVAIAFGLASGVPVEKFKGIDAKTNADTVTSVATASDPQAAIGMVAGEVADSNADKLRTLAYQHRGQTCGYTPHSSSTIFDKRNIRTGQYFIWGNIHFLAKVDANGTPIDPGVAELMAYYEGAKAFPSGKDLIAVQVSAGTVPDCAMEVKRTSDLGDYESYAPAEPCGCYFEKLATGASTCSECESNTDCGSSAPFCRHGFCEVN